MDFRTYLSLEAALMRRLQKSWQERSTPVYTAILAACKAGEWDKAKAMVGELDMASVGVENQEFLKYVLLSCGVFGANLASGDRPTFIGSAVHGEMIGNVVSTIVQYLDHKATTDIQEAATEAILAMEAAAKPPVVLTQKFNANHDEKGRFASIPSSIKDTLFGKQLKPEDYHAHAVKMIQELDAAHKDDATWSANVAAVQKAMANFPMIHTAQLGNIPILEKEGIHPAHEFGKGLAFDKISGLDRTVFMRMGQAGGGGHGAVGVMIDPKQLDPNKLIITRLGAMTLKQQEEAFLKTPGDHSALVSEQLKPYAEGTIPYSDLADVQSRLLVNGYETDHPEMRGKSLNPTIVVHNDRGEMEVKYADVVPSKAIVAYFAGDQPLEQFEGKSAYDYLKGKVPDEKLVKYAGEGLGPLSQAYREHYANAVYKAMKADATGRYILPFESFAKPGFDKLQLIASLNSSRLSTWGFVAEAEVRGITEYELWNVLDGRTSKFCRAVAGKVFRVESARDKVNEVLHVQNPDDLREVQPWPPQDDKSIEMFRTMSAEELTALGYNIPPFHPHCRTMCKVLDQDKGKQPVIPSNVIIPKSIATIDAFKELGLNVTQPQVDFWNSHVGVSPANYFAANVGQLSRTQPNVVGDLEEALASQDSNSLEEDIGEADEAIDVFDKMVEEGKEVRESFEKAKERKERLNEEEIENDEYDEPSELGLGERIESGFVASGVAVQHINPSHDTMHIYDPQSSINPSGVFNDEYKKNIRFYNEGIITTDSTDSSDGGFDITTSFDPYTGNLYLDQCDLIGEDLDTQAQFLASMLDDVVDLGHSISADNYVMAVAQGQAPYYITLGLLPTPVAWQTIRMDALEAIKDPETAMGRIFDTLQPPQQELLSQLLQDNDEHALSVIFNLPWLSKGANGFANLMVDNFSGNFSLDLTDSFAMDQFKEYILG